MKKQTALIFILTAAIGLAGCGSAVETNSNSNAANANVNSNSFTNMNVNELPEGFSNKPLNVDGNSVEGINANTKIEKVPDDVSPAPGIPSANDLKKNMKKGTTPTPGIPANPEIKRSSNSANVVSGSSETADKSTDSVTDSGTMKQQRPKRP